MCMIALVAWFAVAAGGQETRPALSDERVVFTTKYGDVEFAFYPDIAPVTVKHIFKLVTLGAYTGNNFFRVDKGFVAQVQDVNTRAPAVPMNMALREEAAKKVPLETVTGVKHHAGTLSMGRYDDPDSGGSSFSFLLGDAPHLDMKYTIFGGVTSGMETLRRMEGLETTRQGIFVMPKERIGILASYWYRVSGSFSLGGEAEANKNCETELEDLRHRNLALTEDLHAVRQKLLPGR